MIEFNADGSIKLPKGKEPVKHELVILKSLKEIGFSVGKKTLKDFLQGDEYNKTIEKHGLSNRVLFGVLSHVDEFTIYEIFKKLIKSSFLETVESNSFAPVLKLSRKGIESINSGSVVFEFEKANDGTKVEFRRETVLTEFESLEIKNNFKFLEGLNLGQKKAVVCNKKNILCIAGAGSGKTTVLSKRIVHLVKNKGVDPRKILAITFTRKARNQMKEKLGVFGQRVKIHTFNSFCEGTLRTRGHKIYSKEVRVIEYKEKFFAIESGLKFLGYTFDDVRHSYFSEHMKKTKNERQLKFIFVNDCFSIIDHYNNNGEKVKAFYKDIGDRSDRRVAEIMFKLVNYLKAYMNKKGLRDFSDQIVDTLRLFEEFPEEVLDFEHILIDEYQDINSIQIKLIDKLKSNNLFCVGDPRQAIYGWRGSRIKYILDFSSNKAESTVIYLKKNYRSYKSIVELGNKVIKSLNMPDLITGIEGDGEINIDNYLNAQDEAIKVATKIKKSSTLPEEIFVITRTNKQLDEVAEVFTSLGVNYIVKSEDSFNPLEHATGKVTLATAHSIKGLEAEEVYLLGVNPKFFPCFGSEHKIMEFIKDYYDKTQEELRLLYVAITRAKHKLHISHYSKRISSFLDFLKITGDQKLTDVCFNRDAFEALRSWRFEKSGNLKIPPFLVFSNAELDKIVAANPMTVEDLGGVITKNKINRYGDEVVEIVNKSK